MEDPAAGAVHYEEVGCAAADKDATSTDDGDGGGGGGIAPAARAGSSKSDKYAADGPPGEFSFTDDDTGGGACCVPFFERWLDLPPETGGGNGLQMALRRICTNRWVRCAGYTWATLTCGAIYFGWQQFQKVLFRGGVYAWTCTEAGWSYETHGACEEQIAKAQTLYTVASAMEYVVGVFAGIVLDHLGPRCCGLMGLGTSCIGVLLLIASSEKLQLYIPSFFLLGSSVNLIAFPTLLASDFFPNHGAAVISYFISCQIGCALLAVILLAVMRNFGWDLMQVFVAYLGAGWFPALVSFIFLLPCRRRREKGGVVAIAGAEGNAVESGAAGAGSAIGRDASAAGALATVAPPTGVATSAKSSHDSSGSDLRKRATHASASETGGSDAAEEERQLLLLHGDWGEFRFELATWDIQIFSVFYVLQILQFVYFPTTTLRMFGEWMSDFAGYVMPAQAGFGLIMGYLVDRVGTLPLCFLMVALNVLSFALMLIPVESVQYVTIFANLIAQSFVYTSKYTFVTEIYNPQNFGKLAGYIGFLGGVFTFANIPIAASTHFNFWIAAFLVVDGVCFAILVTLTMRKRRGVTYVKER